MHRFSTHNRPLKVGYTTAQQHATGWARAWGLLLRRTQGVQWRRPANTPTFPARARTHARTHAPVPAQTRAARPRSWATRCSRRGACHLLWCLRSVMAHTPQHTHMRDERQSTCEGSARAPARAQEATHTHMCRGQRWSTGAALRPCNHTRAHARAHPPARCMPMPESTCGQWSAGVTSMNFCRCRR
jgi:hypothetical protein